MKDLCVFTVRPAQVQLSAGQQLCVVCHDVANGIHFGAITCEGCKVSNGCFSILIVKKRTCEVVSLLGVEILSDHDMLTKPFR
jgi:hypothetical protein